MPKSVYEAHRDMMASLPVHTHYKDGQKEVNRYTGKPTAHDTSRWTKAGGRVNTWLPRPAKP